MCLSMHRWGPALCLICSLLDLRRWDHLTQHIGNDDEEWLYHKLSYFPGGSMQVDGNAVSFPREGCLKVYRSNAKNACDAAANESKPG